MKSDGEAVTASPAPAPAVDTSARGGGGGAATEMATFPVTISTPTAAPTLRIDSFKPADSIPGAGDVLSDADADGLASPVHRTSTAGGHSMGFDRRLTDELSFVPLPVVWQREFTSGGRWLPVVLPLIRATVLATLLCCAVVNIPISARFSFGSYGFGDTLTHKWVYVLFYVPVIGVLCVFGLTEGLSRASFLPIMSSHVISHIVLLLVIG